MKPSFLVDIERGRKTEIDTLSGTIVRLGEQHGIETPVHAEVVRQFGAESLVLQRAVSLAS
jgi:2-dehydropantoate 2-reductase